MKRKYPHFDCVTKDGDKVYISIRTSKTSNSFMAVSEEIAQEILLGLQKTLDN